MEGLSCVIYRDFLYSLISYILRHENRVNWGQLVRYAFLCIHNLHVLLAKTKHIHPIIAFRRAVSTYNCHYSLLKWGMSIFMTLSVGGLQCLHAANVRGKRNFLLYKFKHSKSLRQFSFIWIGWHCVYFLVV